MSTTYDIFKGVPGSEPIWVEAVQGLENARMRLLKLYESCPGDYFVFDPMSAKIIAKAA